MANKLYKISFYSILLIFTISADLYSQDTVKIMYYNLLNYDGSSSASRDVYFRTVIRNSKPDILVANEVDGQTGANTFLNNVMNYYTAGLYTLGTFIDGGDDTQNAIFYKSSKFSFIANEPIYTDVRYINVFTVQHKASQEILKIIGLHLKASEGYEEQRLEEVTALRNVTDDYPSGTNFIVGGDFNIYSSDEPAYQKLLEETQGSEGHFIDPYTNLIGTWNNAAYAKYHSQNTRASSGGLDDRFDFILNSEAVKNSDGVYFIPNSLIPYGNDGNHYNKDINEGTNTAVADSIADALFYASDHLPVYGLYTFKASTSVTNNNYLISENFSLSQNYPNPFNPYTTIQYSLPEISNVKLVIYSSDGKEIRTLTEESKLPGTYSINFSGNDLASGIYMYTLLINNIPVSSKKMILIK